MKDGSPRILIIRLSAIGDVVRVLPALRVLRERHPYAQIDWAVEGKSAKVVAGHPDLDDVLVFRRPEETWEGIKRFHAFCRQVRARKYDTVIDFHGIFKSGVLTLYSGAHERVGFRRPRAQEGAFLAYNQRADAGGGALNRVEENMRLCGAGDHHHDWPAIAIAVPEEVQDYVDHYVDATFDGGKLLIAMHVPVTRPEKRWPLGHFAELSDMLLADGRFEVALTYGPGQSTCAREVAERSRRYPHIAPDMPDLKHYAWFVGRADLYFGGDTGPMHIAAAMGTPVAAVFGGTDPKQHRPYRVPQEILYRPEAGKSAAARLEAITPEEAYDACVRLATQGGEVQPGSSQDL